MAKAVLISAVPPLMVKTDANPGGLPKSVFDTSKLARVYGHRLPEWKEGVQRFCARWLATSDR